MTLAAVNLVFVLERITGGIMVKVVLYKNYHLVATALMIAVALYTRVCIFCMKPAFIPDPVRQLFMTVQALAVRHAAAQFVAFSTVLDSFVLCMVLSQFSRAYEGTYPLLCKGNRTDQ